MKKLIFTTLSIALFSFASMAQVPSTRWETDYNNPNGNNSDEARGIVIDAVGNSYVTGGSYNGAQSWNIVTIKYDTNGVALWTAEFDNGTNQDDFGIGIDIDGSGNIYVCGRVYTNTQQHNYITIKYDGSNGNVLWSRQANGSGNSYDDPRAIKVANNKVYVTGVMYSPSNYDYGTVAYDSNGNLLWQYQFNNPNYASSYDEAKDIAVDANGNVFVTGMVDNYNVIGGVYRYQDYGTIKLNSSGVLQWFRYYDMNKDFYGSNNCNTDYADAITVDVSGNIAITGASYKTATNNWDFFTLAYNTSGTILFSNVYNGVGNNTDWPYDITADGSGNFYVSGYTYDGYQKMVAQKMNSSGVQQWATSYIDPQASQSDAYSIALDASNNVYLGGKSYYNINNVQWNYTTVALNNNGTMLWNLDYDDNNNNNNANDLSDYMAVKPNGNVYRTGWVTTQNGNQDYGTLRICLGPDTAGVITGTAVVCQGQNTVTYSVPAIVYATGYMWTVPTGATIVAGANTNSITVNYGVNAVSGDVTVQGSNYCINGGIATFPVTVNPLPDAAGTITGTATVCQGQTNVNYYIGIVANAIGYNWVLPAGATIVSGANTNSISVNFANNAVSGNITVQANNSCGNGVISSNYAVTVNPLPGAAGAITGLATLCQGTMGVAYSVAPVANAVGYNWTLPTGATIATGANTNSITVDYSVNAVSGNIMVEGTNSCGNGTSQTLAVIVNPLVAASGAINGSAVVCQGQSNVNYYVNTIANAAGYNWAVPVGATIISGANTNSIVVNFANNAASGNVTVNGLNSCGNGTSATLAVTVDLLPDAAGAITGLATLCQGTMGVAYSVAPIANAIGYNWTLPAGATIATGANTNSITVDYSVNAVSGNVMVEGTNSCGNGTSQSIAITVNPLVAAAGAINGSATVCQGQTNVNYSVNTIANAAGYNWVLPAGATIVAGANTNSIIVDFANNAASGNITVDGSNICGNGASATIAITVNPLPTAAGIITGSDTVCAGQMGVAYSVSAIANATGYNWTLPAGATIATGANTNSITIDFAAGAMTGTIWVEGTNSCGTGSSSSYAVLVNSPAAAGVIAGPLATCQGQMGVLYSVSPIANTVGYSWTLPLGATIAAGANTNVIWVDFAANAVSGNISVAGTNPCGNGLSSSIFVTVNPMPTVSLSLVGSGMDTVCLDEWHQTGVLLAGGSPAGGNYSGLGAVNGYFYPALAGLGMHVITYTYSDAVGCSNTATDSIFVSTCTGINELGTNNNITVYPNPTKGSFTINATFAANEKANIALYNMFGEVVMVIENGNIATTYNKQVNIEELANGVYFLTIQTNGNNVTSKIVKN